MKSVLIVEDEIFIALEIERILEQAGYHVVAIAADRQEALSAAAGVDFAFVDVNLRDGCTGPQIAEELAALGVPLVYVTANPGQIQQLAITAVGCIPKPFTDHLVLNAIAEVAP